MIAPRNWSDEGRGAERPSSPAGGTDQGGRSAKGGPRGVTSGASLSPLLRKSGDWWTTHLRRRSTRVLHLGVNQAPYHGRVTGKLTSVGRPIARR